MNFLDPKKIITSIKLHPGDTVIDFGVGRGDYIEEIEKRITNSGKIFAFDIQEEIVRTLKNKSKKRGFTNLYAFEMDIDNIKTLRIKDTSVDAVIMSNILFMLKNKNQLLKEVIRITKKDSKILVVEWKNRMSDSVPPKYLDLIKKDELIEEMSKFGLRPENFIPAGNHHYAIMFSKIK